MIHLPITFRHSTTDALRLAMIPLDAAQRLRDGEAQEEDWHTVVVRLNVGVVLARWFFKDAQPELGQALDTMAAYRTLTPNQHRVIDNALRLTNEMEGRTPRRDLRKAIDFVFKNNRTVR